ncbi:MAG: methyltransferase domain-containing protein [Hyphomicrobiaceae bacterium]
MIKIINQSQFSESAERYATSPVHASGDSLQALVDAVTPQPEWRVLDIATGPGHTAFAFAPHVGEVVATDLTPRMLEVAQRLAGERELTNISFQEADAEKLPFGDATFDAVTSRIAPHHFERVDLFLSEVARVLKPGGRFGLVDNIAPDVRSTPGFAAGVLALGAQEYNAFEKLRDPGHMRALQFTEWLAALDTAGLDVLHHELLKKPMEFRPWAERLNASEEDIVELKRMIQEGSTIFRAFLRPEDRDGDLWITLT